MKKRLLPRRPARRRKVKDDGGYAIRIRNLSKIFRLYNSPKDILLERIDRRKRHHEFTALENISLDIRHGETVGIIGRNGAGKSTLLKIISGVLDHDGGEVEVNGKVSALLELGSGFNPEYSGRENILFGGMCLGMSRGEIMRKMDDIIEFSELADVIDQPLKTYSTGMQSRLAFATAISVDADILIVDEALSVGDAFFQAKCMAYMRRMQERGATILFVSHSPGTVKQMCDRAVLLHLGKLMLDSDATHVTERYFNIELQGHNVSKQEAGFLALEEKAGAAELQAGEKQHSGLASLVAYGDGTPAVTTKGSAGSMRVPAPPFDYGMERFNRLAAFERVQSGRARFINVQLFDAAGKMKNTFDFGEQVTLRMIVEVKQKIADAFFGYAIRTMTGIDLVWGDTRPTNLDCGSLEEGKVYALDWNFRLNLQHGNYFVKCAMSIPPQGADAEWEFIDFVPHALDFSMQPRKEGMMGGFVEWGNDISLKCINKVEVASWQ